MRCAQAIMSTANPVDERHEQRVGIRVLLPSQLGSYTGGARHIDMLAGPADPSGQTTLNDVLAELDRRFPGLRFRIIDEQGKIRPHIKIFVDRDLARDLAAGLSQASEVMIVGALSGG